MISGFYGSSGFWVSGSVISGFYRAIQGHSGADGYGVVEPRTGSESGFVYYLFDLPCRSHTQSTAKTKTAGTHIKSNITKESYTLGLGILEVCLSKLSLLVGVKVLY